MGIKRVRRTGLNALLVCICVLAAEPAWSTTRTLTTKSGSGFGQDNSTATWLMASTTTQSHGVTINEMTLCPSNDISAGVCSNATLEFYIQILNAPDDATVTLSGLTAFDGSTFGIVHCEASFVPPQDTLPLCTANPPSPLVVDATIPGDNSSLTLVFAPSISSPTSNYFPSGGITFYIDQSEVSSVPAAPTVSVTGHAGAGLTPTSLTFGSQTVGTTSALQGVILTNGGESSLTIAKVQASGDFAQTNNCRALSPLAAGASCSIFVSFSPSAAGTRTGSITVIDNAPSATQVISLSGTGDSTAITLSPPTLAFGTQAISSSSNTAAASTAQTITFTNSSLANADTITAVSLSANPALTPSGDFNIESGSTCTNGTAVTSDVPFSGTVNLSDVSGGSNTCTLVIDAQPLLLGPASATVTITDSTGTHLVALSTVGGTPEVGIIIPSLSSDNPPLPYSGTQLVGTSSSSLTVQLSNVQSIKLNSILAGAGLKSDGSTTCAAGGALNCNLFVDFSPTTRGDQIGSIIVTHSMSSGMAVITSTGTAIGPGVSLSPPDLNFPVLAIGHASSPQSFTLLNNGTTALTITSVTPNNSDFAVQTNTCPLSPSTLGAGASCTISIKFTPSVAGPRKAAVVIADDAADSPQYEILTGAGSAASVAPPSLTFTGLTVGTPSTSQVVTLSNLGAVAFSIWQISFLGANASDFSKTTTCASTLGAGNSCTISVIFTPGGVGARTTSLWVCESGGGNPLSVTLTGTGLAGPTSAVAQSTTNLAGGTSGAAPPSATSQGNSSRTNGARSTRRRPSPRLHKPERF